MLTRVNSILLPLQQQQLGGKNAPAAAAGPAAAGGGVGTLNGYSSGSSRKEGGRTSTDTTATAAAASAGGGNRWGASQVETVIDSILQDLQGMSGTPPKTRGVHFPQQQQQQQQEFQGGAGGIGGYNNSSSSGSQQHTQQGEGGVREEGNGLSWLAGVTALDLSTTLHLQHACVVLVWPQQQQQLQLLQQQQQQGLASDGSSKVASTTTSTSNIGISGSISGGGAARRPLLQPQQYLVLDLFSGSSGGSGSSSSAGGGSSRAVGRAPSSSTSGSSSSRSLPLLRCHTTALKEPGGPGHGPWGLGSSISYHGHRGLGFGGGGTGGSNSHRAGGYYGMTGEQGLAVEVCLTRCRVYLVGDPFRTLEQQQSSSSESGSGSSRGSLTVAAAGGAAAAPSPWQAATAAAAKEHVAYSSNRSSSGSSRLHATCILDAAPGLYGRPIATATSPISSTMGSSSSSRHGHGAAAGYVGSGSSTMANGSSCSGTGVTSSVALGADDHPPGAAIFVDCLLDPTATADGALLTDAIDMATAHAKNRWECEESAGGGAGWGVVSELASHSGGPFGLLGFQSRCRQGSAGFCHVKVPRMSTCLARPDLLALLSGVAHWGGKSGAAAAGSGMQSATAAGGGGLGIDVAGRGEGGLQMCFLAQCRIRCNLQMPVQQLPGAAPGTASGTQHQHHKSSSSGSSSHAKAGSSKSSSSSSGIDLTAYEMSVEDLTVFHVSGLGGAAGATATSVSVQGLQLLHSPAKAVVFLLPRSSSSSSGTATTNPGLEVLQVMPGPATSSSAGQTSRQTTVNGSAAGQGRISSSSSSEGIVSVVLRGATVALDEGSLTADWVVGLVDFFSPPATASHASATATPTPAAANASSAAPGQSPRVVLNLQDLALRYEPSSQTPLSHNTSRIAAALLLEGAYWSLNPSPSPLNPAPQWISLNSLRFYVAAAAARTGGGPGGWSVASARDLPGLTLVNHGYHCVMQEGGLKLLLRPQRGCGRHGGEHNTW